MHEHRSAKVRKILRLEGHASRLLAHYEGALADVAPSKHKAEQLLHRARALKVTLTPTELSELRSARNGV